VDGFNTARAKSFKEEGMTATFVFATLGGTIVDWWIAGPNIPQKLFIPAAGVETGVGVRSAESMAKPSINDISANLEA